MSPTWISGTELLERWAIKGIELFRLVQEGLQSYTELCDLKPSPDVTEKVLKLKEVRRKLSEYEAFRVDYGTLEYDEKKGGYYAEEYNYALKDIANEEYGSLITEANLLQSDIENADCSWGGYKLPDDKDAACCCS